MITGVSEMKKFKILMLTPEFSQGGTESYILNVCRYLSKNNIYVIVMSDGGVREKELDHIGIKHVKVNCLKTRTIKNLIKSIIKLRKVIKLNNINIIHTSSIYTTIVAKLSVIIINRKIKIINTLHGGPNKYIEKTGAKILNVFADKVVALSNKSKRELIKYGLNKNKIVVIYNGIKPLSKLNLKKNNKIIIGTCGRIEEQKGHKYLIEAISKIDNDNIEIWIIGDGELRDDLYEMAENFNIQDRVKFLGFRSDIEYLLNKIDIFILPSLWEQFPISILEAMSLGKPIIATNVNGIPEELGDSGILIGPGDVLQIVSSIKKLILDRDLRQKLSRLSEKRFYDNFTVESMCSSLIKLYRNT